MGIDEIVGMKRIERIKGIEKIKRIEANQKQNTMFQGGANQLP